MAEAEPRNVTALLIRWRGGDQGIVHELLPLVHDELRRLAQRHMAGERRGHMLQPTALVNEVYLRLIDVQRVQWQDRAHFFAMAGRLMRRVLVDLRPGPAQPETWRRLPARDARSDLPAACETPEDVIAIDTALEALAGQHPRKSEVVELRFFGGLSVEETADVLRISEETVMREGRQAWLLRGLSHGKARRLIAGAAMRRPFVLAVLLAIAFTSAARAARPSFAYEVVVEGPSSLQDVLRDRLGYGGRLRGGRRPTRTTLATSVAVSCARRGRRGCPAEARRPRRTSTPDGVDELRGASTPRAAARLRDCAGSRRRPRSSGTARSARTRWWRPHAHRRVADRRRLPRGPLHRAQGRVGAGPQQAAADGFAVTRLVTRPQPNVTARRHRLHRRTTACRGRWRPSSCWRNGPSRRRTSTVHRQGLLRPGDVGVAGVDDGAALEAVRRAVQSLHEYEVEERSAFMGLSISSTDGALLGIHRVKDGFMTLYDGKDRSPRVRLRGGRADRRRYASAAAAARAPATRGQAQRGRRPLPADDVAWRDAGTEGSRAVDVILARKRD